MTPITRLSTLAVLLTIVVDIPAGAGYFPVDPLVMAVYSKKYNERRITFADLKDIKDENLKLPLDAAEPEYFVILCGNTEYRNLMVRLVTERMDWNAQIILCAYHQLPSIKILGSDSESILTYTGYNLDMALWEQEHSTFKRNELFNAFHSEFEYAEPHYVMKYLRIDYNYIYNVPKYTEHTVKAHMHSDKNEQKCEEIRFKTFTEENKEYRLDTLHNIQVLHYKWRQLVPMQDFKGTYATTATCTYLNYLLLHEKAIDSLERIENFIRYVADVINEVSVESGTYTPEEELSFKGDTPNQTIIPSIVWKKITYRGGWRDYYTILAVIHNTETKRICEHEEHIKNLGLPKWDNDENNNDIGTMYYCVVENEIRQTLRIPPFSSKVGKPLNLKNPPFQKGSEKTISVTSEMNDNKQAT